MIFNYLNSLCCINFPYSQCHLSSNVKLIAFYHSSFYIRNQIRNQLVHHVISPNTFSVSFSSLLTNRYFSLNPDHLHLNYSNIFFIGSPPIHQQPPPPFFNTLVKTVQWCSYYMCQTFPQLSQSTSFQSVYDTHFWNTY